MRWLLCGCWVACTPVERAEDDEATTSPDPTIVPDLTSPGPTDTPTTTYSYGLEGYTWMEPCYDRFSTMDVSLDIYHDGPVKIGQDRVYGVGADATGFYQQANGEWYPLRLPDIGVPNEAIFPPTQLHVLRKAWMRFASEEEAFWWNGVQVHAADPLPDGVWHLAEGDRLVAAQRSTPLSAPGTVRFDDGSGVWTEVDTSGAPVDGEVTGLAPLGATGFLFSVPSATGMGQTLLTWSDGSWQTLGDVPYAHTDWVYARGNGSSVFELWWAVSDDQGVGAIWTLDDDGSLLDTGYIGGPLWIVGPALNAAVVAMDAAQQSWVTENSPPFDGWEPLGRLERSPPLGMGVRDGGGLTLHYPGGLRFIDCEFIE